MIIQKCKVCGREFETVNPRYTLCSEECRKIRHRETNNRSYQKNKEDRKENTRRKRWSNAKTIPCQICGKPVEPRFENNRMCRKHYHEDCIIREAVKAYKNGEKFGGGSKMLVLARNQGINKADILEYMEDLNEIES